MAYVARLYFSPSPHGKNVNLCRHKGCYEDNHTRPIANAAAKYLRHNNFYVVVADENRGVYDRCADSNKLKMDWHIPVHTNAASPEARYLLFMAWSTTGDYAKMYNCFKGAMEKSYDGPVQFWQKRNLIEINTPKAKTMYLELGFHTNEKDCNEFIHDADARGKEIAKAFCEYYGVAFKDIEEAPAKPATPAKKKVISEDGEWGRSTTTYTQKLLKTYQDGIVSGQLNSCKKYLPSANTTSWEFAKKGNGSAMVEALQEHVGLKGKNVDGFAGKTTVTAMQNFLKKKELYTGPIDGIMGYGTVVAWQKYINSKF